jgi:hypothetical protein
MQAHSTVNQKSRAACRDKIPAGLWYGANAAPVGILSNPGKMPGWSYGMSAGSTCPGAVTGANTICGSCYAKKGSYGWPLVTRAYAVRKNWTQAMMMTDASRDEWVRIMVASIAKHVSASDPYFRIHDSGDFYTPRYIEAWAMVAAQLPWIHFWAPTRSWRFNDRPRWAQAFATINALANVTVRPSALYLEDDAPLLAGFAPGSTVKVQGWNCPSSTQGNRCQDCRACWNTDTAVAYRLH